MPIGVRIGPREGSKIGPRIGAGFTSAPTSTTQTVTVADSADPVITGGDAFVYTVQYTNTGLINATSVQVQITVDASLSITGSSGTGWSLSTVGNVVTATKALVAPGAANPITINVTTGGSALTATTSAQATAGNATTANGSQNTAVQLVTKDATAGWYLPANATELANFTARKGLTGFTALDIFNCQEPSGTLNGAGGTLALTLTGAATYQQTQAGFSRKFVVLPDGASDNFTSSQAALPNIGTTSGAILMIGTPTGTPAASRNMMTIGTAATAAGLQVTTAVKAQAVSISNNGTGTTTMTTNAPIPLLLTVDRTNNNCVGFNASDKMTPTFNASMAGQHMSVGAASASSNSPPLAFGYIIVFSGANAEHTSTQWKALVNAMGITVGWS